MHFAVVTAAQRDDKLVAHLARTIRALSCSRKAARVERKTPANSAQEFDALISTIRTASIRGRGGSTPNNRGGSPLSTQLIGELAGLDRLCVRRIIISCPRIAPGEVDMAVERRDAPL
jgi:hypothetical protein